MQTGWKVDCRPSILAVLKRKVSFKTNTSNAEIQVLCIDILLLYKVHYIAYIFEAIKMSSKSLKSRNHYYFLYGFVVPSKVKKCISVSWKHIGNIFLIISCNCWFLKVNITFLNLYFGPTEMYNFELTLFLH